ncbi:MAG: universal stress protein [Solirubrobacteraceae bacterium]
MASEPLAELSFHRLLVAVDGSENSDLALSAAITAARRSNATVALISVSRDVMATATWPGTPAPPAQLQEDADAYAQKVLREAAERIPQDVGVTTIFKRGKAGPVIVAEAAAGGYDAILLGARGLGRVGALLGSVSNHVLHHATIAVFVAHAPSRPRAPGPRRSGASRPGRLPR